MTKLLSIQEHKPLTDSLEYQEVFGDNEGLLKRFPDATNACGSHMLGCFVEGWPSPAPRASYYIGLTWIEEGKVALQVYSKIKNVDFLNMFMSCLRCKGNDVQEKIMHIYGIDFKKRPIEAQGLHLEVTPFIIIHFLSLLEPILKKGLKHNYLFDEDNLQSKLKGKLMFSEHFKKNILNHRQDRNYCNFQEYSIDCKENQILKKALKFADAYMKRYRLPLSSDLQNVIQQGKKSLAGISDIRSSAEIERFRVNPLFKEYSRAISVAKLILRRFGYDLKNTDRHQTMVQPFWMDMSLLFETYVLGLLTDRYGKKIKYHIATTSNEIDFGKPDEKMIIDSKYIYHWADRVNHENIRQLSGYARNKMIRQKLMGSIRETEILPCLIMYPSIEGIETFTQDLILDEPCNEIDTYLKFYKLGIKLPMRFHQPDENLF